MMKLREILTRHDQDVLDYLDTEVAVEVSTGLTRQGDVIVIPAAVVGSVAAACTPVPQVGFPVVRGEAGGNTHSLHADGDVYFDPAVASAQLLSLGVLTVTEGATAFLIHPQHGALGAGPGTYQLRRQRQQADELRLVQD